MMSLHEETCSDAKKLAHEIHNDVVMGEADIARAIEAGFCYREARLQERIKEFEHTLACTLAERDNLKERLQQIQSRLVRRVNELIDQDAVLKAQVVGLQGRLENQRKK